MWPFKRKDKRERRFEEGLLASKENLNSLLKYWSEEEDGGTWVGSADCPKCGKVITVFADIHRKKNLMPGKRDAVCPYCETALIFTWEKGQQ